MCCDGYSRYGYGEGPIYPRSLFCTGEKSCYEHTSCSHFYDVGVVCLGNGLTSKITISSKTLTNNSIIKSHLNQNVQNHKHKPLRMVLFLQDYGAAK